MVHYPTSFWCQEKASLSSEKAEFCAKFNTAHHIAKEERTFTLFNSEVLLQKQTRIQINLFSLKLTRDCVFCLSLTIHLQVLSLFLQHISSFKGLLVLDLIGKN